MVPWIQHIIKFKRWNHEIFLKNSMIPWVHPKHNIFKETVQYNETLAPCVHPRHSMVKETVS
jgi:hypothetical protein